MLLQLLLQADVHDHAVDIMNQGSFSTKDVIYICVLLVGGITAFVTLKVSVSGLKEKQKEDAEKVKEAVLNATNGRRAIKKELLLKIGEVDTVTHKRIDAVRDDLKSFVKKADDEFKELNKGLNEIKGMLTQIINSK